MRSRGCSGRQARTAGLLEAAVGHVLDPDREHPLHRGVVDELVVVLPAVHAELDLNELRDGCRSARWLDGAEQVRMDTRAEDLLP